MNINQLKSLYYRQTSVSSLYLLRRKRAMINSELANYIDSVYRKLLQEWFSIKNGKKDDSDVVGNSMTEDGLISDMILRTIPIYRIVISPYRDYNASTAASIRMSSVEYDMLAQLKSKVVNQMIATWNPDTCLESHRVFKNYIESLKDVCIEKDTTVGDIIRYLKNLMGDRIFDEIVAPMLIIRDIKVPYSVFASSSFENGGLPDDFESVRASEAKLTLDKSQVMMVTLLHDKSDDVVILRRLLYSLTNKDVLRLSFLKEFTTDKKSIEDHSGLVEISWADGAGRNVTDREFDAKTIYRSLSAGSLNGFFVRLKERRDILSSKKKTQDRNVLYVDRTDVPTYGFEPFCRKDNQDALDLITLVKTRNVVYGPSLGASERSPSGRNSKKNERIRKAIDGSLSLKNDTYWESVYTLDTEIFNQFAWGPVYRAYGNKIINSLATVDSGVKSLNLTGLYSESVKVIGSVSMISSILLKESRNILLNIKLANFTKQEVYDEWERQRLLKGDYKSLDDFIRDLSYKQGLSQKNKDLSMEKGYSIIKII